MPSEEQEILKRIQHLKGRIDRRKQRQRTGLATPPHPASSNVQRDASTDQLPLTHGTESDSGAASDASGSSWITRNDRHLQLINSSAYRAESRRLGPIDPGRVQRPRTRIERGRPNTSPWSHGVGSAPADQNQASPRYSIAIDGIPFSVANNGSKLIRLSGDPNLIPKTAVVSGVEFQRTRNGNLVKRPRGIQAHRAKTKLDVPCKYFSTTGSCPKGPTCRYQHDVGKVAICRAWLLQGQCPHGEDCDLSHDATPERVPLCLHYAKGACSNPNCLYAHVDLAPGAQNCRSFGLYGYCEKGVNCPERHSFECPDFANTGFCNNRGCKLVHRERASVLRKAAATAASEGGNTVVFEAHSSASEAGESSDVDSDDMDELIVQDDTPCNDFVNQSDFIEL